MTSTTTSGDAESKPDQAPPDEPGFGAGLLPEVVEDTRPEPAGDLRAPEDTRARTGVLRGRSVDRPEVPKAEVDPNTPQETELVAVTADGREYQPPVETKNVSEHPLYKLKVEVDAAGLPVLADGPQFVDQFTNPHFAKTVIAGPFEAAVCDLSTVDGLQQYNQLMAQREPMSAPRVQFLKEETQFDPNVGNWKIFIMFRRISYRKVVT